LNYSQWSVIDFIFAGILAASTLLALTKGLARELISLASLICGFFLAAVNYRRAGGIMASLTGPGTAANLLGFLAIFLGCLTAGALLAWGVNRFLKMTSLEWFDRLLGGVFGLLRGWAIASILVLALIAFPVTQHPIPPSVMAPYLLAGARAAAMLVPPELKDRFSQGYQKVLQAWNESRDRS